MGNDYEGTEGRVEVGKKLARIETLLDGLKEQISTQYTSIKTWQAGREAECGKIEEAIVQKCGKIEEAIVQIRIELATQKVKVGIGSVVGSAIMAAAVAYFMHR